jgi:alkaline phosphatase D
MPRNISRRELLTKVGPAVAATVAASKLVAAGGSVAFQHGVASGDPTQTRLIIWSRVTTNQQSIPVVWELSKDDSFTSLVCSGVVTTSADTDYTIKIDADLLQAGTFYYYRFSVNDIVSTTGRARTLPMGQVDSFKLGICSCSNYPAGYFNAYAAMADREDLDLVVHLGDYIYEYDALGYASQGAEALGRVSEPLHEATSLADFRRRHGQYRTDKSLQRLHAKLPFILSWDDHEFANDSWHSGAENANEGEGIWADRKAAAVQAYYEWMPIREPANKGLSEQWRSFEIGDLASLIMLETRISARDEQVDVRADMRYVRAKFDLSDPAKPRLLDASDEAQGDPVVEVNLPHKVIGSELEAVTDYRQIKKLQADEKLPKGYSYLPDMQAFRTEVLDDPKRQLLGAAQRNFVAKSLSDSKRSAKTWQVVGNQTLVAKVDLPNLADKLSETEKEQLSSWMKPALGLSKLGLPFGTDSWNGYGAERENFLNAAAKAEANLIVLTGDTHASWAFELQSETNGDWQGIELGATSISSPGLSKALGVPAPRLSELLLETNDNLKYSETAHHGFLSLELTSEKAVAEFHRISGVSEKQFTSAGSDKFLIQDHPKISGIEIKPA